MTGNIKLFVATKALINFNGKVLILRESGKYEDGANLGGFDVPGGRIKPGQRFDESLLREILEETGLTVKIGSPFHTNEWRPVVRGEQWQIVGTYFECFAESDDVTLSKDHDQYEWIDPQKYEDYKLISGIKEAFIDYNKKLT